MFEAHITNQSGGRVLVYRISQDAQPLFYSRALELLESDESFLGFFIAILRNAPFPSYRWETPAVTSGTLNQPFQFVILDNPGLAQVPDREAFADHFHNGASKAGVVAFENLGKDAILVAPFPLGPDSAYGHLAAFVRTAPEPQQHALWQVVARKMIERISARPVWLSTAGAGISWLHVRLDSRPKYYGHAPYRKMV